MAEQHGMKSPPKRLFSVEGCGYVVECVCGWRCPFCDTPIEAFAAGQDHLAEADVEAERNRAWWRRK